MDRKELLEELRKKGISFSKLIFKKQSAFQKARYKSEFVGWEAWVYQNDTLGYLITQEDWEDNSDMVCAQFL